MNTASFLFLFATLTIFQSAAGELAGYKSPISFAKKTSPIEDILELHRLPGETICTRTEFPGNATTVCERFQTFKVPVGSHQGEVVNMKL
eukprot:scaffold1133_cov84-Cylindrotheca_fusiformis.AAC.3